MEKESWKILTIIVSTIMIVSWIFIGMVSIAPANNTITTMGFCHSIENNSIHIDAITYHCKYIMPSNKQYFVGKEIEVTFSYDEESELFEIGSMKEL